MEGIFLLLAGAVITWVVALIYYQRASQELKDETAKLRKHTATILRIMEDAKLGDLVRDKEGNIIGRIAEIQPSDTVAGSHVSKTDIDKSE